MSEIAEIARGLSAELKLGWAIWLAWALFLLEWYFRGRGATLTAHPPPSGEPTSPQADMPNNATLDSIERPGPRP